MGSSLRGPVQLTLCPGSAGSPGACGAAGLTAPPHPSILWGGSGACWAPGASPSSFRLPFTPALSPGTLQLSLSRFFQILPIYLEKSPPPLFIRRRNRQSCVGPIVGSGERKKAKESHRRPPALRERRTPDRELAALKVHGHLG